MKKYATSILRDLLGVTTRSCFGFYWNYSIETESLDEVYSFEKVNSNETKLELDDYDKNEIGCKSMCNEAIIEDVLNLILDCAIGSNEPQTIVHFEKYYVFMYLLLEFECVKMRFEGFY